MNTARGKNESQLHNIKKKKRKGQLWGFGPY